MISLRRATAKDAEILASWFNDRTNTEYMDDTRESYDAEYLKDKLGAMDFIILLDEKPIGYCFLYDIKDGRAEISVLIGDKAKQGKGYGKEALRLLCDTAFKELGLKELFARVDEDNAPSLRILDRCGFYRAGKKGRDILFFKKNYSL
ncbi:MAG: GNAT family N-acetyltransferase [Candidatus Thermoplasmatota archaeon]|nr:GNAT family N-acetyltransferase [Candidatus Thermoplasmatota archaeon]